MKLSVRPEKEKDDEYENEADDDFRLSSQQPSQPAQHGLQENFFDQDEDAFTSDYQSHHKSSRRHTSLEEKRIDLEMLKEKNRNLELRHSMKRACTFSGPEESSISTRSRSIKRPKKTRSIIEQTMRTSVLFAIRSKVVPKVGVQKNGTKS